MRSSPFADLDYELEIFRAEMGKIPWKASRGESRRPRLSRASVWLASRRTATQRGVWCPEQDRPAHVRS